ncbi:TIGR02757 family protein [Helicobacter cappadocius]|uniref:TIGR02757 family protein n=1 Tax=Helicobacter cappadocius TaxID=3063998 RepID=A0AA90PL37_9HELI|nr:MULTISPECIES: TIGR02757 family protein [unclassified Helicobacter]MDO7252916.1 TIGR02757 family protein [Helicobacter sp. faydin-H75]MDP2539094.1 TIGR02757 family protein [Helicobacter sp. faydin-H76]
MRDIKALLDQHYLLKNNSNEVSVENPDPLLIVRRYKNSDIFDEIALICALLSYGSVGQIVRTLDSLDFSLLHTSVGEIQKAAFPHYRFQTSEDIRNLFIVFYKIIHTKRVKSIVLEGYDKNKNILEGVYLVIDRVSKILQKSYLKSRGLEFLIGKVSQNPKGSSPLKRWNMYLRWMVRKDNLDFGRWEEINKSDLILPLDTHTFKVSQKLGLLDRKSYDLYSALLITDLLKKFDANDPVKYDFALYRLGQSREYRFL